MSILAAALSIVANIAGYKAQLPAASEALRGKLIIEFVHVGKFGASAVFPVCLQKGLIFAEGRPC